MSDSMADWIRKGYRLYGGVLIPPESALTKAPGVKTQPTGHQRALADPPAGKRLVLPYPPSVNGLYGVNRHTGQRYLTKEGKTFHDEVRRRAVIAGLKPLEGDVAIWRWVYRPRKIGDLTNRTKCLDDSLEGILYLNDKQIIEEHGYRFDDPKNPRIEVLVYPL